MKLVRATIYGFGNWVDDEIEFAGQSYICIYGENESGKSTLQQFILFMLFGLPPKMRAFYQPKTSGKMGGRLTMIDDSGEEFTIERLDQVRNGAATCYTPKGGEFDEAWLQGRLNGMTNATYQSIFSFSGLDLSGIKQMKEEDLGEVLLGIGLTGAKNMYTIEKRLDNKIGELFKRYGKKPVINQQLATLDELFINLKKHENEEATYREKKAGVQATSDEITNLQSAVTQLKEERLALEKQQHALPVLKEFHHYTKQLSKYPSELTFPENGLERLDTLKEKLLPLKSELSVVQDNQVKYQEKQTALRQKLYEKATYEQAIEIRKEKQLFLENQREMTKLEEAIKKLAIQIDTEIDQLNVGLTAADLATISFPFHIEKTWHELKNNHDQLNAEQEQLDQEEIFLKKQQKELYNQQQEIEGVILSEQQVDELTEKMDLYNQHHYIQNIQDSKDDQRTKWKQAKKQKEKQMTTFFIGSVIAAIVLALIASIADRSLFFSGSAIVILLGIGQYIWGKQSLKMTEQVLHNGSQETSQNPVTMEKKEKAAYLLAKDNEHRRTLDSIHEQLKPLHLKLMQAQERKATFEMKEKRFTEQIKSELADYPFLEQVSIVYWPECYHAMKQLLQLDRNKREYTTTYQQIEQDQRVFQATCRMFFEEINGEAVNETIESQLDTIDSLLEERRDTTSMLMQYDKWITEAKEQQRIVQQKMRTYEEEITALFTIADVNTEEDFLKKAKQLEGKEKVSEQRSQLSHQLAVMFSGNVYKAFIENEAIDEHLLQGKYEQTTEKMDELDNKIEVKRQHLADLNAEVANMESSETYSSTLHRFTMEQEQLEKFAREWAVLKTAKEVLVETKRNYREKYLTKVMNRTAAYFAALTGDHYTKVYAPSENFLFQVEASDGIRYTVHELSQGTIDQLYVSLRLAISEVMSEEHRLPFIIDDAFIYFDSIRTKRVMKILAERAGKQQMIVFTCKKEVQEAAGDAKVIRLGNSVRVN